MISFKSYLPRVRQSKTKNTLVLWGKSLLNAFLFLLIFMVVLPWVAYRIIPVRLPIPPVIGKWGGGILVISGVVMWIHCLGVFSHKGRGTPLMLDAPQNLVTSGLFSIVRNPIMIAELMVLWGEVIFFSNPGMLMYAVMVSGIAHMLVVYVEEPELKGRFGKEYEKYCQQVPRWFPEIKRKNEQ